MLKKRASPLHLGEWGIYKDHLAPSEGVKVLGMLGRVTTVKIVGPCVCLLGLHYLSARRGGSGSWPSTGQRLKAPP